MTRVIQQRRGFTLSQGQCRLCSHQDERFPIHRSKARLSLLTQVRSINNSSVPRGHSSIEKRTTVHRFTLLVGPLAALLVYVVGTARPAHATPPGTNGQIAFTRQIDAE